MQLKPPFFGRGNSRVTPAFVRVCISPVNTRQKVLIVKLTNNHYNQVGFSLNVAAKFPYSCHGEKQISSSIPSSVLGGSSRS
jgi:hypothetical protein